MPRKKKQGRPTEAKGRKSPGGDRNDKVTDDLKEDVKKTAEDLKRGAKKVVGSVEKEFDNIDLEKEALGGIKELENMLSSLTSLVKEKRKEWEESGVNKSMKKDARSTKKKIKETTIEVLDDFEKAAKKLKKKIK